MSILHRFQKTVVFILKATLYILLGATFFFILGTEHVWLLNLSRTAGVTLVTFCVLEIALVSVFGGYAIGRLKSKPIITSLSLATLATDVVTHLQLCIMNVNENNNDHFIYESPLLLLLVMVIQVALTVILGWYVANRNTKIGFCVCTAAQFVYLYMAQILNQYVSMWITAVFLAVYAAVAVYAMLRVKSGFRLIKIPRDPIAR